MQFDQCVERIQKQSALHFGAGVVLQCGQVGHFAEVFQGGETVFDIVVEHLRHMHGGKNLAHAQIGLDAHFVGRRVHADHALAVFEYGAEIAAEIGIRCGEGKGETPLRITFLQPVLQFFFSFHDVFRVKICAILNPL